jgi:hypothetical protein
VTPGDGRCSSGATRRSRSTAGIERAIASDEDDALGSGGRFPVAMMNRRGIVRAHSHWRPQRRPATMPAHAAPSRWPRSRGGVLVTVLVTAVAGLAIAASSCCAAGARAGPSWRGADGVA